MVSDLNLIIDSKSLEYKFLIFRFFVISILGLNYQKLSKTHCFC